MATEEVSLDARRTELVQRTLSEVKTILKRVVDLRFSEEESSLFFNASTNTNCYQVELTVASGSVQSGTVTVVQNSNAQTTVYKLNVFPILFVHQVAAMTNHLLHEVAFVAENPLLFRPSTVDRFIKEANQIICVFADPKFTEVSVIPYFEGEPPSHLILQLQYRDGMFFMKYSGLVGAADMLAPDQKGVSAFKELEKCFRSVVKSLKYLRSDACTWGLPD